MIWLPLTPPPYCCCFVGELSSLLKGIRGALTQWQEYKAPGQEEPLPPLPEGFPKEVPQAACSGGEGQGSCRGGGRGLSSPRSLLK